MEERSTGGDTGRVSEFKDTLNLPRTDFPLRGDSKVNDPLMLERWEREGLSAKVMSCNSGSAKFILHDGPPYANGSIHLGHAYNKILKDIIAKAHRMMGFHVPLVPGWDCHGLPIEHKVLTDQPGISGEVLKKACRTYALRWVHAQRDEFKRLGVLMDWQHPYITMDPLYEASIVRAFAALVREGYVERKNKTVPWCFSCKTTLATAEIEYQDRTDPSLYVLFELSGEDCVRLFSKIKGPLYFVVWTTTPWTLPLNRAVWLKNGAQYQRITVDGKEVIVAESLAPAFVALMCGRSTCEVQLGETFSAEIFEKARVYHPLVRSRFVPIIMEPSVSLEEGTACVHCAPGCGPLDYEVAVKNGLEIFSPLSADGRYTSGIEPVELEGMTITQGQEWVTNKLVADGMVLNVGTIRHSYPHCWRCHKGLMFRATPQWFCNLAHKKAKERALEAVEKMAFFPAQARSFLRATIENRWEWCLSRQKAWGVPIPALVEQEGTGTFVDPTLIEYVAQKVEKEGIEFWDRVTIDDLVKEGVVPASIDANRFRKESDILDVWFDSGVSHYAVLAQRPELAFPADLYLEGIDQHRGWFQSSLLTGIMIKGEAPMRAIITHGFTVDEKGRKMSKSLGNVVAPQQVIDSVGTDGLRLWVASVGLEGDALLSDRLLQNVGQVYRKIRNTSRFLLQNLYDFDFARDAIVPERLEPFDRYAIRQLLLLQQRVLQAYKQGNPTAVYNLLNEYCTVEVSSFYGDVVKDRLYCEKADGLLRRSAQTTFWYILDTMVRLAAPIMSFAAEQVADYYQPSGRTSIHMQRFADLAVLEKLFVGVDLGEYDAQWQLFKEMRSSVLKLIEAKRAEGVLGHSLEAAILLAPSSSLKGLTVAGDLSVFLPMFFIVSSVAIQESTDGLVSTGVDGLCALASRAPGVKCPRCWQWEDGAGSPADSRGLCRRCVRVLQG